MNRNVKRVLGVVAVTGTALLISVGAAGTASAETVAVEASVSTTIPDIDDFVPDEYDDYVPDLDDIDDWVPDREDIEDKVEDIKDRVKDYLDKLHH